MTNPNEVISIPEPKLSHILFADTRLGFLWLFARVYVGWAWLEAGWGKFNNPAWVGENAGAAVTGFLNGALQKVNGPHPDVQGWYAFFIENIALPNSVLFSYLVTLGELAVGICLILGLFTGISAFFGAFMNMNFLFAGTVSSNPLLFLLELFIILAWRTAGWIGLDRWVLPMLGTPWQHGRIFPR